MSHSETGLSPLDGMNAPGPGEIAMTDDIAIHVQDIVRALQGKLDPNVVEDELRKYLDYGVPLAQAKRDMIRNHGGSLRAGKRGLADLAGGESGVELLVKVQTVNEKQIQGKDGTPKTIWYGFVADETKSLPYTAWKDFSLERGRTYDVRNAYVRVFRDQPDINLGDYATVALSTATIAAVEGYPKSPATFRATPDINVKDLHEGLPSITVHGRILDATTREVTGQEGPRSIVKGTFADATGRIPFTAWRVDPALASGAAVRIRNAYVKAWRGAPELNLGDAVVIEPVDDVPAADDLLSFRATRIGDLDKIGGGSGVETVGVVLEIRPGSGLIFRCPQCTRVLQKRECRIHGRVEGVADLRIKSVLDDGWGHLTLFVGKEGTERLIGRSFEDCQRLAKDAMSTEVIEDEIRQKVVGRRLRVRGNATKDDFGLQIIAQDAQFAPAPDVVADAQAILEELADLGVMGVA
ncbi:MAG: hypothetical protein ACYDDF_09100 [Thermoplasmatota archaeon]